MTLDRFFVSNMKNVNQFITIMLNVILFQQKFNIAYVAYVAYAMFYL